VKPRETIKGWHHPHHGVQPPFVDPKVITDVFAPRSSEGWFSSPKVDPGSHDTLTHHLDSSWSISILCVCQILSQVGVSSEIRRRFCCLLLRGDRSSTELIPPQKGDDKTCSVWRLSPFGKPRWFAAVDPNRWGVIWMIEIGGTSQPWLSQSRTNTLW